MSMMWELIGAALFAAISIFNGPLCFRFCFAMFFHFSDIHKVVAGYAESVSYMASFGASAPDAGFMFLRPSGYAAVKGLVAL